MCFKMKSFVITKKIAKHDNLVDRISTFALSVFNLTDRLRIWSDQDINITKNTSIVDLNNDIINIAIQNVIPSLLNRRFKRDDIKA